MGIMKAIVEYLGLVWNAYRLMFRIAMSRNAVEKAFYASLFDLTVDDLKQRVGYRGRA